MAVAIRGDREVNPVKLTNFLDVEWVELAGEAEVERVSGAPVGFAGPIGLPESVRLIADQSVRGLDGFVCGGNQADAHYVGARWGRDAEPSDWLDLMLVKAGDHCPHCQGPLDLSRGIEVGHIFKLGTTYSKPMKCVFTDEKGADHPMSMGCYGLGIGRTVAAAIEQNHDENGIIWPLPLAPFEAVVVPLNMNNAEVVAEAQRLYDELLEKGVDVLLDDRAERPGVKFKDADLIGFPVRLVVGEKSLADDRVELSERKTGEKELVPTARAVARVLDLLTL